ncbi:hypothetical protein GCM10011578_036300 [Streptomyces fuscichromogenes]|uniref:Uncharacterized protein n=1 Tax=Streptomyces fuscichromogenes TaxID=1324013 RepID=A0A918CS01_9ACTN|nr:hypothetical protein GCM10011578_036300 [Streptomyces fuscichromogenes]
MCAAKQDPAVTTGSSWPIVNFGVHRPAMSAGSGSATAVRQNDRAGRRVYGCCTGGLLRSVRRALAGCRTGSRRARR